MGLRQFAAIALLALVAGCQPGPAPPADTGTTSVAVLVVAHGSPAAGWTAAVQALVDGAGAALRGDPLLKDLQLAYIAESGPTIAEQMRRFDAAGIREVVIVPLLVAAESTRTNNYLQACGPRRRRSASCRTRATTCTGRARASASRRRCPTPTYSRRTPSGGSPPCWATTTARMPAWCSWATGIASTASRWRRSWTASAAT
jgi:hypothetical protein